MLENYFKELNEKGCVYISVKVRPNSSKTDLVEILEDETFKINIAAVPEKGKANAELIKFLGKKFKINKENIKIISGHSDRHKLVKIIK